MTILFTGRSVTRVFTFNCSKCNAVFTCPSDNAIRAEEIHAPHCKAGKPKTRRGGILK